MKRLVVFCLFLYCTASFVDSSSVGAPRGGRFTISHGKDNSDSTTESKPALTQPHPNGKQILDMDGDLMSGDIAPLVNYQNEKGFSGDKSVLTEDNSSCSCINQSIVCQRQTTLNDLQQKIESLSQRMEITSLKAAANENGQLIAAMNMSMAMQRDLYDLQVSFADLSGTQGRYQSQLLSFEDMMGKVSMHLQELEERDNQHEVTKLVELTNSLWADVMHIQEELAVQEQTIFKVDKQLSDLQNLTSRVEELMLKMKGLSQSKDANVNKNDGRDGWPYRSYYTDCDDVAAAGNVMSGVYEIWIPGSTKSLQVYCRITDGRGWLVIHRKQDGLTTFDRTWADYEEGFGNLYGDFWLGNAYLSLLSTHTDYSLQLQLTDWEGHSSWLHYHQFRVEGKDTGYKILTQRFKSGRKQRHEPMDSHNGKAFSTPEMDIARGSAGNCAQTYKMGWWFGFCPECNVYSRSDPRFRYWAAPCYAGKVDSPVLYIPAMKYITMEISRASSHLSNLVPAV